MTEANQNKMLMISCIFFLFILIITILSAVYFPKSKIVHYDDMIPACYDISYFKDLRSNLCFATVNNTMNLTCVPCDSVKMFFKK